MSREMSPSVRSGTLQVSTEEYNQFRAFLEQACGILLGENKQYLVASRLNKIMAQHNMDSLSQLIEKLSKGYDRALRDVVVDAMTTNETLWFRDAHPFELFKNKILPDRLAVNKGGVRVWSAACSSGQEPYSLSMVFDEFLSAKPSLGRPNLEVVATDLSQSMLAQCRLAEYDSLSLGRGLSNERLQRFFEPAEGTAWRVKSAFRQKVRFQALNLKDSYSSLGKFDAVFCRNVLIYFSAELKKDILTRIHGTLKTGGYLVLGASEGLTGLSDYYEMIHCHPGIIYKAV